MSITREEYLEVCGNYFEKARKYSKAVAVKKELGSVFGDELEGATMVSELVCKIGLDVAKSELEDAIEKVRGANRNV